MRVKFYFAAFLLGLLASFSAVADDYDCNCNCYPDSGYYLDRPWSIMLYHGTLAETDLGSVLLFNYPSGEEKISSIEGAYGFAYDNPIRRFFQPWITAVSFATNVSHVTDPDGSFYEVDPFFLFEWRNFAWDKYLVNTFGIGWGVSYDSRVSVWESRDSGNTKRLLNYLAFEATAALPQYPQLQLVLRIHHRSGAFGLYGADNAGSNFVGLGLRYYLPI